MWHSVAPVEAKFFGQVKHFNNLSSKTWIEIRIHQKAWIRIQWFRILNYGSAPTDGIAGWRRLEAHGLPVGGLDVLEVVRVRLLVVTVLLDLLLEQAHRVPIWKRRTYSSKYNTRTEPLILNITFAVSYPSLKIYAQLLLNIFDDTWRKTIPKCPSE